MNMQQMKKLYRHEHSTRGTCLICNGKKDVREMQQCCADGSVIYYPLSSPGLRAFARSQSALHHACVGKLASIVRG